MCLQSRIYQVRYISLGSHCLSYACNGRFIGLVMFVTGFIRLVMIVTGDLFWIVMF